MKNLLNTLSFIGLSLSLSLSAQTSSNKAKSQIDLESVPQDNAKSAYIANQDYLSSNSMSVYKNVYGDSLKGFNEKQLKSSLLAGGISGLEIQGYMHVAKRRYINNKYGIGVKPTYLPDRIIVPASPNSGGKTIGGNNTINLAPCVNEDFESSALGVYTTSNGVTGWTITSRLQDGSCAPTGWTAGSPAFSLIATPILSWGSVGSTMGVIPNSPLGGTVVAQLNNQANSDYNMTRISQTFPVTTANTVFQFAYAGYWQDGGSGHGCCPALSSQPGLNLKMYDCVGAPLSCSNLSLSPGTGCQSSSVTFSTASDGSSWTNWQVKFIDLTPYIGTCVTIEVISSDCSFGGHWGSTLFDARCGGQQIGTGILTPGGNIGGPVSFCAGANQAIITAPIGYASYQWYAPGTGSIAAPQGTMASLTINSPLAGSVYTVQLIAASGCVFTATNAIAFSTITIAGIGSFSTCAGGASGSATVVGNGSGTGYNYTWINPSNSATIGTAAVVNNLAPGTYSVVLTALGSAGCGSAVATVTVGVSPPGIVSLLKPFCGNEAYLGTAGGTNFQWYNNLSPITASLGGNNSSYTVTSPVNGSIYWLSYLSFQGCQDSVKFTLISSQPGLIQVPTPALICPNANNGIAQINLSPAPGAPAGLNSYSVYAIGTTPVYNASLFPTASNTYSFGGLSSGTYSVNVFDGSCKYGTSFNIAPLVYNFTVTPPTSTLCPGNSVNAAIVFSSPPSLTQYSYKWTPTTHLFGTTAQNAIITPVIPVGTSTTIVYTIVVTPSLVNCPITKTISVTAINPPTPTITTIPNLCNNSTPYLITTNPPGGVFSTGITGTNNPISSSGGVISPTFATIGVNTLTYSILQYTCSAKNTATYQVSKFWTSALSSTVPPLCVNSPMFNLMNIVQNTQNGSWSGQTAGTVNGSNMFNPAVINSSSFPITGSYLISYNTTSTPNPTVCPSTTTISVVVTKTTTPVIANVPEFCTNAALINMTVSPTGGGWLPNVNSAVSAAGVISPTLVTVPGITVTYTVADGPCINSNTTALHVSRYYPAGFSGTVNPLCFNSTPFNLMSIAQSTVNGVWTGPVSSGTPNPVLTNTFFPSQMPTGVYTVTYSTISSPNPTLCTDTRVIDISVLHPIQPIITQVGPICSSGSPMQLTVTPTTGMWTASPYLSSTGLLSPGLASVGNNVVQYVVGTSTCNVQQTKVISIEAFVPATIMSAIPDLCNTSPVLNLVPFTLSGQGVWSGPGISGASFNPGITGSGNFVLTHKTASSPSGLCPDQALVSVNVFSLALPQIKQVLRRCNNALPFQLEVSPVGGLFGGPDMGIVSYAGLFNPAAAIIGDNLINYSITSGPCVAYAQTIVQVERFVSADLAKQPGPFCKDAEAVNMNSYAQNPTGTWSMKDNQQTGLIANMFHPSMTKQLNTVLVYMTYSEPTHTLCPDNKEVTIEVRNTPVVVINAGAGGCSPVEVLFSTGSTNYGEGIWNFGDGSEPVHAFATNHIFTTPGVYNVQFNYTDDIGCRALPALAPPIEIFEVPKADFTFPDEIYISEPQIQLTNLTSVLSNNKYEWKVSGMAQSVTGVNPVITVPKIGKYQITLIATSGKECKDEITKTIEVKNIFNVFIPNSFSPNFDGLNDYFMPTFSKEGLDARSFEMEIFDRWGHSLYHTKDATVKGWDGSVQNKGEPVKEEVYVYRIKYKDMDGNAYSKMGHLSLVK